MNMKKTIAAIAAGAVAVSAMATTVSALEAKTLTYNLVKTVKLNKSEGKITANFDSLHLNAGDEVVIFAVGTGANYDVVSFEISGSYWDDVAGSNKSFNRIFASENSGEEGFSLEGSKLMGYIWDQTSQTTERGVTIPVKARATGTTTSLVASTEVNIKVVAKYKALPAGVGSAQDLNNRIKDGNAGLVLNIRTSNGSDEVKPKATLQAQGVTSVTLADNTPTQTYEYIGKVDGTTTKEINNAGAGATINIDNYKGGTLNLTYKTVADAASPLNAWVDDATGFVVDLDKLGITITGTPQVKDNGTSGYTATSVTVSTGSDGAITAIDLTKSNKTGGGDDKDAEKIDISTAKFLGANDAGGVTESTKNLSGVKFTYDDKIGAFTATVNGSPLNIAPSYLLQDPSKVQAAAAGGGAKAASTISIVVTPTVDGYWNPALNGVTITGGTPVAGDKIIVTAGKGATGAAFSYVSAISGSASDVKGAGEIKYPFKTTLTGSTDVITSIYSTTDFADQADGTKVAKTINPEAIRAVINDAVVNYADVTFVFNTAAKKVAAPDAAWGNKEAYVDNDWDAEKVIDYTQFGRHFWDSDPGYDTNTVYITNDWIGNNLFEGALIINKNLTLSLAATDKFDWTATSLSFSWDAIQDAALTNNAYANYIHNMILRTSATWYWDNFQVVLGATEEEEVGTTSPVEAEEEELEDTEDEPEVEAEPEEEEEEEEEESEPEPEPEPVAAPVVEKNPGTGNAPVALAVIPVALAAAAVVAKKRG